VHRFKVDFDTLDWESPLPGARFKVYRTSGKQIRLVEFTSAFVEPDWCERAHVGLVLEGALEVDFHGDLVTYETGEGLFIPAGSKGGHKARSLTPVVRLVLVEDA
jgi:quercetin dioxygenase-like cupin family protein